MFHATVSVTTRAHSGAVVTSARMAWKRWVSGERAFFEMDVRASARLSPPRATMIMLAPFAASWRAAPRPRPFEPPVIRMVYGKVSG